MNADQHVISGLQTFISKFGKKSTDDHKQFYSNNNREAFIFEALNEQLGTLLSDQVYYSPSIQVGNINNEETRSQCYSHNSLLVNEKQYAELPKPTLYYNLIMMFKNKIFHINYVAFSTKK